MRSSKLCLSVLLGFALGVVLLAQDSPSAKKIGTGAPASSQPKVLTTQAHGLETYGTAATSYYRIPASEFTPMDSTVDERYSDYWYDQPADIFGRYSIVGNSFFIASPHLPSGATITYLELDACNTNATEVVDAYLYDCTFAGDCSATAPVQVTSPANSGCGGFAAAGLNISVDNFLKEQVVRVATRAADNTTRFAGVIIGYHLNVSPAPGTATFPDVPTSDFGFQYVEALVASGITGGCGGGLYCPDSPVTRRQMAIFIAKALGLQFE
jgi:S-layer homology domain